MQFFVRTLTGKTITIEVEDVSTITVGEFKQLIADKEQVPIEAQDLRLGTEKLTDDSRLLSTYKIMVDYTLYFILKVKLQNN